MKQELITKKKKLPEGWKWVRLGDKEVSKIIMGQSPPSFTYNTEKKGLPFYQGKKDFGLHHPIPTVWCSEPKRIAEEGDILISVRAPVGPTNIANEKCCIGRGLAVIRPKIERDYLLFLLKYNVERLKKKGRGSTFDAINKDKLYDFKIILPPLPERQKIVSKLDKQMAQIEMMKKEAEKEKEASEAYYESFTNYLILNLKSGILSKISDVCKEYKKQLPPASEDAKKRIYIGMEDISSNTGIVKINQSNQGEKILSNTFQFDNRHILYGKLRPYLNKVVLPNYSGRCSTELIPLLPKENCKRDFLALLLRTKKVIHAAMENKTGSRMPRADMREVMKVEFKLPSLDEQERIIRKFIT